MRIAFAAVAAAGLLSGCVPSNPPADMSHAPIFVAHGGLSVQSGIPCSHLIEDAVNTVAGCEGYIPIKPLTADEAAQIAHLNTLFAASVSPLAYFEFDKSDLTAAAVAVLDAQADWMLQHGQVLFTVYGHTDLVGSEGYNFDLAKRRAETVVAYLASRGVPSAQLEALVSYGETRPTIVTEAREGQNRRTVTEVSAFLTEPRLLTAEWVPCVLIAPRFLPTYPSCVPDAVPYIPPPPPPIDQETSATTGHGSQTTSTDARYFNDGTTEIKETNGSAGNGAVTTGVRTQGTAGRETVTINVGGRTDVYERNADGSGAVLVSSTPNNSTPTN